MNATAEGRDPDEAARAPMPRAHERWPPEQGWQLEVRLEEPEGAPEADGYVN